MSRATELSALLLFAGGILAGGRGSTDANLADCQTTVDSGESPAPGVLTLHGQLYPNETVELLYMVNGETKSAIGTVATQRPDLTLTNIPPGTRSYDIRTSCVGGVGDLGSKTLTVLGGATTSNCEMWESNSTAQPMVSAAIPIRRPAPPSR